MSASQTQAASRRRPEKRGAGFDLTLTTAQGAAARRYSSTFERYQTATDPSKRLNAGDDLKHARAVLMAQHIAIMDLVVGKGRDLSALAEQTGRSATSLAALLIEALDRLSAHYEAEVG